MSSRAATTLWVVGGALATALVTLMLMGDFAQANLAILALWAPPAYLWIALRRRLQTPVLSPVWLSVLILAVVGTGGFLLQHRLNGLAGGGMRLTLNDDLLAGTALLFAGFAASIALGATFVALFRTPAPRESLNLPTLRAGPRALFIAASAVPAFMILTGGGADLLVRDHHLAFEEASAFTAAAAQLAVGAVAVLGYLYVGSKGGSRFAVVLLAATYFLVFFATSSRRLALFPVVFALGAFAAGLARGKRGIGGLLVGGVLTLLLLPLPLYLRSHAGHGLFAYLEALPGFSFADVDWWVTANNVLIAFPIAGQTAFIEPALPIEWLWIQLNPLPGELAGWYEITPYLGLNDWTPYSAIGELGNWGPGVLIGVGILFGVLLAFLDGLVGRFIADGYSLVAVMITGVSFLASVTMLQYSLRTTSRILLYITVAAVAAALVLRRRGRHDQTADVRGTPGASSGRSVHGSPSRQSRSRRD